MDQSRTSLPVHIVATESEGAWKFGRLLVGIVGFFITTWLVMLLLPTAFGPEWAWSYWRTAAAILVVRLFFPRLGPLPVPLQFTKNKTL